MRLFGRFLSIRWSYVLWYTDLLDVSSGMDVALPKPPDPGVNELVGHARRRHHDLAGPPYRIGFDDAPTRPLSSFYSFFSGPTR